MFNGNYSLADIAAATGSNDRNGGLFGDSSAWWIIILFLFCFAGGWGQRGGNAAPVIIPSPSNGDSAREAIAQGFDVAAIQSGINSIQPSLCSGFAGITEAINNNGRAVQAEISNSNMLGMQNTNSINNAITTSHYQTDAAVAALAAQEQVNANTLSQSLNQNFATLNYNLATEACADRRAVSDAVVAINNKTEQSTRQILDFLVSRQIDSLEAENANLRGQISQSQQNAYLIQQLRPTPNPAYMVANPYTSPMTGACPCAMGA